MLTLAALVSLLSRLRVTMVFKREAAGWRIVHRQADSQTVKQ